MAAIDPSKYSHSPIHKSILSRDYYTLKQIISSLPRLSDPSAIKTEASSTSEEAKAEAISAIVDRRDVPNRETPLHLSVKLGDASSIELLMLAGADWSLQNEQGWSALQEAICNGEENLAKIIVRHYQPLAWAKWCRRLPRVVSAMKRMRDFYMEITFHFESSVIPFVSRIAPSDTYKIWKRGANLRADMTLAGFDGFKIKRKDQSVLFLGDGGSLCIISHKDKEVMNALEGAGAHASEAEIEQEVLAMSKTSIFRPGVDVTQAVLLPQLNWRRQEKTEIVGPWKARVYDMHHVVVSVKSRKVPGAMSDEELFSNCNESGNNSEVEEYEDVLTNDERKQLEVALRDVVDDDISCHEQRENQDEGESKQDGRRWFGGWGNRDYSSRNDKEESKKILPPRSSLCVDEKVSDLLGDSPSRLESRPARHSVEVPIRRDKDKDRRKSSSSLENGLRHKESSKESKYKKGLRPVLWLSPNFPLQTEELLPLLDILANKVKAIHRLRDLLTTKLPTGTFPVKVAIPVVPTVRVLVTFTKFEELQPFEEEFLTPSSSPGTRVPTSQEATPSSWFQWMKTPYRQNYPTLSGPTNQVEDIHDPFLIPPDYTWTTPEAKKKKMQENKAKPEKGRGP